MPLGGVPVHESALDHAELSSASATTTMLCHCHCNVPLSLYCGVQAVWVAGQYADIPFSNPEHFNSAFHAAVRLLSDPELPCARGTPLVALRSFIEASAEDLELLRPLIPQLLNGQYTVQ